MRCPRRLAAGSIGSFIAVSLVACAAKTPAPAAPAPAQPAAPSAVISTPFAAAGPLTEKPDFANQLESFEAAKFSDPTRITNTWLPLAPGTQRTYDGAAVEDGETHKRHFVQTVTDLTKTIMGVRTVVVWAQDFDDGELKESQLAFF